MLYSVASSQQSALQIPPWKGGMGDVHVGVMTGEHKVRPYKLICQWLFSKYMIRRVPRITINH
ncbi:hypothetical protein TFKS16_1292 [Tannerella forsythia KS16]|nr:hypothetical protein TFKS16_1292 [Tannerella forsythia KS16]